MPPGIRNFGKTIAPPFFPGQAKTELCAAVSIYLSLRFFRYEGLNDMF